MASYRYCCSSLIGEMGFVTWFLPNWTAVRDCFFRSHRHLGLEHVACLVSSGHQQKHSVSSDSFLISDLGVAAALDWVETVLGSSFLGLIL
jgi:hypothetical protein